MPIAATKTKEKGITEIILFKFEETCESGNRKHVLQFIAHASDTNLASLGLGSLQNTQEQAQTTRRDKLQLRAIENNVLTFTIIKRLQLLFCHRSSFFFNFFCKVRKNTSCLPILQKQLLFFNLHLRTTFDLFRIFATNLNKYDRHHTFQFP